jgi:hypothetical protein
MSLRHRIARLEELLSVADDKCPLCGGFPVVTVYVIHQRTAQGFRKTGECWLDKDYEDRITGDAIDELRCAQCGTLARRGCEMVVLGTPGLEVLEQHAIAQKGRIVRPRCAAA